MKAGPWKGRLAPPPDPPELPEAARPRWPPWYAPAALFASFGAIFVAVIPVFPAVMASGLGEPFAGLSLLALLLVQDGVLIGTALLFAGFTLSPRAWHFGVRSTRPWPTIGWTVLGFALMLGVEVAYIEGLDVDESNVEELGKDNLLAAIAVVLAVVVVAPVSEELFFRSFFYRALRTRLRVWSAALIDGLVFGALHFEGPQTAVILPVIAVFGVGQCLVYERTGSVFSVIAIHAAFNTVAMLGTSTVVAIVIGGLVIGCCVIASRKAERGPSPFGRDPRARPVPA